MAAGHGTQMEQSYPLRQTMLGMIFRPQIKIVSMGNNYFFQNDDVYTITKLIMSAYGTKVVAVLDTSSTFGVTIKQMRDQIQSFAAGQVAVSVVQPQNPNEGQLWFDKAALKLKIYINDGNSSQWVEI